METVSQMLTPVEIKNKEFKKSLLGYSPHEVILFLDQVAKVWERVQVKEKEMLGRVHALELELEEWKTKERELELIRAGALEEAAKIRAAATDHGKKLLQEARDQAREIQGKTQEWLADVIASLQDTDRRRQVLSNELRKKVEQHVSLLEESSTLVGPLDEQLSRFLESRPTEL